MHTQVRGYKSASGWGFPRGKVNHKETDIACACREVRFGSTAGACGGDAPCGHALLRHSG